MREPRLGGGCEGSSLGPRLRGDERKDGVSPKPKPKPNKPPVAPSVRRALETGTMKPIPDPN